MMIPEDIENLFEPCCSKTPALMEKEDIYFILRLKGTKFTFGYYHYPSLNIGERKFWLESDVCPHESLVIIFQVPIPYVNFEYVLDKVSDELKERLLFHLDYFS